jgi:hypothetical protein
MSFCLMLIVAAPAIAPPITSRPCCPSAARALLMMLLLHLLLLLLLPGCTLISLFAALCTAIATAAAHTSAAICYLLLCLMGPLQAHTVHDGSSTNSSSSSVEQLLYARPLIRGSAGSNSSQDCMHHCRHVSIPYKRPEGHLSCRRRHQKQLLLLLVADAAGR